MPIVDGLTSTKLIRSFERTHPAARLSARAALNGRIPIIAVSASLVEKEKQTYVDAGFDAWILKPISFPRLNELMKGIVDVQVREEALYKPGNWERGGWFEQANPEGRRGEVDTRPGVEKTVVEVSGAITEDDAKAVRSGDGVSEEAGQVKSLSMPQLGKRGFPPTPKEEVKESVLGSAEVATPEPINEDQG